MFRRVRNHAHGYRSLSFKGRVNTTRFYVPNSPKLKSHATPIAGVVLALRLPDQRVASYKLEYGP